MPTYDYLCDSQSGGCGHQFEQFQNIKEEPLTKCPKCKKKKVRRLFGLPGVKFVGSGFHCNDYPKNDAPYSPLT